MSVEEPEERRPEPEPQPEPGAEDLEEDEEERPEPPPHGQVPPEEPAPEAAAAEAPPRREMSLADLTIWDTLRFVIGLFGQHAWIDLGLVVAPGDTETRLDLAQARVAIDTLDFVVRQLEPQSTEEEKREMEHLLANLRINYVQKSG